MHMSLLLFLTLRQGKIAPVYAMQLVKKCTSCVIVTPQSKDQKVRILRILWGSDVKLGDRIALKGFVYSDTIGGPKEPEFMSYEVPERSIVFLRPPPARLRLTSTERFADLPMIHFGEPRQDCQIEDGPLVVGKVMFSPTMKHSRPKSVSLDEVVKELVRMKLSLAKT